MPKDRIILFDGVCNLCHGSVQFVIERDPNAQFKFASLQSEAGQRLLNEHGLSSRSMDSIVLIERGASFTKSDAALRIVGRLSGLWPWLIILLAVPRPIRNWVYDLVARNRYRWFGKKDACMIPTREMRGRFL